MTLCYSVSISKAQIYMPETEIIKQRMNSFQTGIPVTKECGNIGAGMVECTYVLYTFIKCFVNDNEIVETSSMSFHWS